MTVDTQIINYIIVGTVLFYISTQNEVNSFATLFHCFFSKVITLLTIALSIAMIAVRYLFFKVDEIH